MDDLEQRVVVTLYEVTARDYYIRHDTPTIGVSETITRWSKDMGLYSSRDGAEKRQQEIADDMVSQSKYSYLSDSSHTCLHIGDSWQGMTISVKPLEADKDEIAVNKKNIKFYNGRKIL